MSLNQSAGQKSAICEWKFSKRETLRYVQRFFIHIYIKFIDILKGETKKKGTDTFHETA